MPALTTRLALLAALLPLGGLSAQTYVDLDFSNNVQPTNAQNPNGSTLGPDYYNGLVFDFAGAGMLGATSVDVRATMIGLTDGESSNFRPTSTYQFTGWLPDYNAVGGANDLGVYYIHDGNGAQPTGGIAWTLSFYEGGSNFSTPLVLPGVRFLIYDHDGEPFQSESIRAFGSDGLTGYRLHDNSGIQAVGESGNVRFNSRGLGHSETAPDGGMILYYENTSSVRFDLFSTTLPQLPGPNNGIFAAWDGDLGLTGGSTQNFGSFVAVPEPGTPLLVGGAMAGMLLRRGRAKSA
jgi:hypothetical protein